MKKGTKISAIDVAYSKINSKKLFYLLVNLKIIRMKEQITQKKKRKENVSEHIK